MNYEVNKIIEELYTCLPNDRNKFNNIMDNLKQQFLSSGNRPMNFNKGLNSQLMNENSIEANNINKLNFKANTLNNVNNPAITRIAKMDSFFFVYKFVPS